MREEQPFFSIIVPHLRSAQLATCFQPPTHLDYPRERFEVIVVDVNPAQCRARHEN